MTATVELEADLAALAPAWAALAERSGASPFAHPDWFAVWWEAFGDGELHALTLRRDGELAAVLPLARRGRTLRAPVNWHTPAYGPVAADPEARSELLCRLFSLPSTAVELSMLGEEDLAAALACARTAGRRPVTRGLNRAPYLLTEGDWETYERGVSRGRRREVARQWRRLRERGEVSFDVITGGDGLEAGLEETFAVEASGWKTEKGTAIVSDPRTRAFYAGLARRAAERGWLRLALLRLDGRAVACDFALEHDGVWYALKGGYDESLRALAPGMLLLHAELERAFTVGLRRFELLGEPEPYKLAWTDRVAERSWLKAHPRSPYGVAATALLGARERVRPVARRIRRRVAR